MSRESAYRMRRRKGAEAFAEAWDVARTAAVRVLADSALDRAIYGVEQPVFHKGEKVGSRTVMSDGLAMFLLRHMDPGTFGKAALNPDIPLQDLIGRGARQLRRRIHALFGPRTADPSAEDDPDGGFRMPSARADVEAADARRAAAQAAVRPAAEVDKTL